MDITRGFFHGRFPVKFAKLSKIFLAGVRLRHSVLLVYNERTFSRPCHHRKEPYIVRANSAVRRHKEPYIRNSGIPSHSKQGTLHKEPLAATHQSHRKEG
mgnify:CR=1 FL=1